MMQNGNGEFRVMLVGGPKADHREWAKPGQTFSGVMQIPVGETNEVQEVTYVYQVVTLPHAGAPNIEASEVYAAVYLGTREEYEAATRTPEEVEADDEGK